MKQKIYLFTNIFPFGYNSECFLENEILVTSLLNLDVTLIPLQKGKECREIPANIKICRGLISISYFWKIWSFLRVIGGKRVWKLFFDIDKPQTQKEWYQAIKYLYGAFLIEIFLIRNKHLFQEKGVLYSYWSNHTPLGLCLAREKDDFYKKFTICSRAHGYDVYERLVGSYFPYRNETLAMIDAVYVVSQTGCDFLQERYPDYKNKIKLSYLGVFPIIEKYHDKETNNELSFVSCSSVIPIKRVECIFSTLNEYCRRNPQMKVKWMHIGGGKGLAHLSQLIQNRADNLTISLQGFISNNQIRELYKSRHFDIFINLSSSEGIPVSIMEAISAGIPVIATNAGGNHEIVVSETGKLVPVDFIFEQFEEAVNYIYENIGHYRKTTLSFHASTFSACKNYTEFYHNMTKE